MFKSDATTFRLADATHNQWGQINGLTSTTGGTSASQMNRTYSFAPATGNLTGLTATALPMVSSKEHSFSLAFSYDHADTLTHIDEVTKTGAGSTPSAYCYTYDGLGRLKTAKRAVINTDATCSNVTNNASYNLQYGYAADRLSSVTRTEANNTTSMANYTYDDTSPHQTTGIAGGAGLGIPENGSFSYNADGKVTQWSRGGAASDTYIYDGEGWTKDVRRNDGNGKYSRTRSIYDADGIRIARETVATDSNWNPLATGESSTVFYLGNDIQIATSKNSSTKPAFTARRTYSTPDGRAVAIEEGGTTEPSWTWVATDQQGTVRLARRVGTTKNPLVASDTSTYTYLPYGDQQQLAGSTTGTTAPKAERAYLNKEQDPNGDLRLDHRSYDPSIDVLTTPDPLLDTSDPQNLNPYAYARNNPIDLKDPSGLAYDPDGFDAGQASSSATGKSLDGNCYGTSRDQNCDGMVDNYGANLSGGALSVVADAVDLTSPAAMIISQITGQGPGAWLSDQYNQAVDADPTSATYSDGVTLITLASLFVGGEAVAGETLAARGPTAAESFVQSIRAERSMAAAASEVHAANGASRLAEASSSTFRAADNIGDWSVSAKHLPGAGGRWNKWAEGVDINGSVASALRSGGANFLPNAGTAADRFIVRTNMGSVVGTRGETSVKVVVSNDGHIITAYPVK